MAVKRMAWALCALALLCGCIFGQTTTGTLIGTVTDPSDATVAGARVELTNTATRAVTRTTTAVAKVIYDGTEWQLQNPQTAATLGANSFTGTQTITGNVTLNGSGNGVVFPDGTTQTTSAITSVTGTAVNPQQVALL